MNQRNGYELQMAHQQQAEIRAEIARHRQALHSGSQEENKGVVTPSRFIIFCLGLVIMLLLGLGLVACGDAIDTPSVASVAPTLQQQPATTIATEAEALPLGNYTTALKARDFRPEIYQEIPALHKYVGQWELQLTEGGHFSVSLSHHLVVKGEYSATASQIILSSSQWPSICKDYQTPTTASYYWHLDGQTLSLLGQADTCNIAGTALLFRELTLTTGQIALK